MTPQPQETNVGRTYAGVLGPLAFFTVLVRGLGHGAGVEATLVAAMVGLIAFSALGSIVGQLADWIVRESVWSRIETEAAALETKTASGAK